MKLIMIIYQIKNVLPNSYIDVAVQTHSCLAQ